MIRDRLKDYNISDLEVLDLGCGHYKGPHGAEMSALPFKKLVVADKVPRFIRAINARAGTIAAQECMGLVRVLETWLPEVESNSYDVVVAMYSLGAPPAPELVSHCERIARKETIIMPEPAGLPAFSKELIEDPPLKVVPTWNDPVEEKAPLKEQWSKMEAQLAKDIKTEDVEVLDELSEEEEDEEEEDEESDPSVKSILVTRRDVHGDVMVATSVLPGLRKKYPNAEICFLTSKKYGTAVENNPYIDKVYYRKVKREFDLEFGIDHHMQWDAPMAEVHCRQCGVPVHEPELYLTEDEIERIAPNLRNRIIVCNNAGWTSRTCPNLVPALESLTQHHDQFLQIDHGKRLSRHIEHVRPIMRDAYAIIYHSKLYIGIDTVWMHAFVALGKPMVLCMGVTGPETQYIRNATIIRPMRYIRPATPSAHFSHGAKLRPESILLAISTKLSSKGETIDNRIPIEEEEGKIIQYV